MPPCSQSLPASLHQVSCHRFFPWGHIQSRLGSCHKLNHKHTTQCMDPPVPPEMLFMIEMVVLPNLNLTPVSSGT